MRRPVEKTSSGSYVGNIPWPFSIMLPWVTHVYFAFTQSYPKCVIQYPTIRVYSVHGTFSASSQIWFIVLRVRAGLGVGVRAGLGLGVGSLSQLSVYICQTRNIPMWCNRSCHLVFLIQNFSVLDGQLYGISVCDKNISGLKQHINITVNLNISDVSIWLQTQQRF